VLWKKGIKDSMGIQANGNAAPKIFFKNFIMARIMAPEKVLVPVDNPVWKSRKFHTRDLLLGIEVYANRNS